MTSRKATWLGIAAILLWSLSIGLTRSLSESLGVYYAGAAIYGAGALSVRLFVGKPKIAQLHPIYLWVCGALFVLYMTSFVLSIGLAASHQQSLEIGLINYLWPSLTLGLAVAVFGVKARGWLWFGMLVSFSGVAWAIGNGNAATFSLIQNVMQNPVAYGFGFTAAISWALYSNLVRRYGQGRSALTLFLACTSALLLVMGLVFSSRPVSLNILNLLQALLMGLSTSTAYLCWDKAMRYGNITLVTACSYFTPLSSLLLASLWLATPLSASLIPAIIMVVIGSLICWSACRRQS
jgi:drug/metabolite transporter (DMT)-like permease